MPKKVTYRGTAHRATITKEQWEALGLSSSDVEWNGFGDEQEVANDAAEYLAEKDDRFEVEGSGENSAYALRLKSPDQKNLDDIRRARTGKRASVEVANATSGPGAKSSSGSDSSKSGGSEGK